jgi:hypothetical protein
MALSDQLADLRAGGVIRADLYPDGSLKAVEFAGTSQGDVSRQPPERPRRDDLRDTVVGDALPALELDPKELVPELRK